MSQQNTWRSRLRSLFRERIALSLEAVSADEHWASCALGIVKGIEPSHREAMQDVEQEAQFRAPKYLACYRDVLAHHLRQAYREPDTEQLPYVRMMLELGVSPDTHVSLMTLG